ncbi:MAG: DNA translocase FtsK 4TM domain-containing protein [Oscillospiraceae bacterium]|nr:DNA translocase FtsK 4TM domain-containing protein [Oscillospiraceae bacterium]MDY2847043.1 DNA translocase FtsK 4TM domain-containing protein [Oscillospiraceae bacterium]
MAAGKNTRSTKGKASSSAKGKSSSGSSRGKAAAKNQNDRVLWSAVMFAAGVLVLAFAVVKGESAWLSIHNFFLGMFGAAVFLVPPVLMYTSLMIARDTSGDHIKGRMIQSIILIVILCGMLRIFSSMTIPEGISFMNRLTELYESGKELMGGGLMSLFLGETLLAVFGKTGAGIIISLLAFVWILLLFNKTVFDILRVIKGWFVTAVDARDEYEEVPEPVRKKRPETAEFKEPPGAAKSRKQREVRQAEEDVPRDDFDIDIAIPSKQTKKDKKKAQVDEEADIIAQTIAANESVKNKAKAALAEQKQNAAAAKQDMNSASGELDDIIRKAALSGRNAKQSAESAAISGNRQEKQPSAEEDTAPASNVGASSVTAAAPSETAPMQTMRSEAPAAPRKYTAPPATVGSVSEKHGKGLFGGKSSTLASNKITDEEDLDMPEAMTAKDIQKEINAEEKKVIEYHFPPIELLRESHNDINAENAEAEMKANADILVNTLKSFGVMTRIVDIHRGPTVTRYELQPSAGVKISKITNLADDIALNLAAEGVRIEAPIPGKAAVGIEVPNRVKDTVTMRDIIGSEEFKNAKSKLTFAVGKNIDGEIVLGDISKLPHVIIAGTTGSGKSVCTNGIIMSILYNATPDEVRMVLIDPKVVEFKIYDGIPHLLIPVVTDPRKAAGALAWAVQEMLKRYKLFADRNVRDINGYNEKALTCDDMEPLPRIVIIIDELADLMMAAAGEVEDSICRLAQMARAAGMHLIIATQRPTVDVITGLIKANIPSRIALKVASGIDSRSIINEIGAEKLLGQGDMLYFPTSFAKPVRVQNCFTSDKEVSAVVDYIKNGSGNVEYDESIMNEIESNIPAAKGEKPADNGKSYEGGDDDLIERAIECVVDNGQCSTSYLQRKLKLGYARAARIVDELEEMGVVGPQDGAKPRQVLMTRESYLQRRMGTNEAVTYYDNTPSPSSDDE